MRPASSQVNQPVSNDPYLARATANPAYVKIIIMKDSFAAIKQRSSKHK